ncbi:MAG TPA: right-handed parallel beta-helix repeat-containing protein [Polyangiaceae bacterium]|nr:right-handed parallel beta-helix repeat-containing protein [Polyangiaceae bacterium]
MTRSSGVWLAPIAWLLLARLTPGCDDVIGEAIVRSPGEISGGTGGGTGTGASAGENGGDLGSGGTTGGTDGGDGASGGTPTSGGAGIGGGSGGTGATTGGGGASTGGTGGSNTGGTVGQPPCPVQIDGFATVGDGVTGGLNGTVVKVKTPADFKTWATKSEPVVIQIDTQLTLTEQIRPKSDKTIVGIGKNAELVGGGLYILDAQNVIVQNLRISKVPASGDAITVQNSQRVWIDHCDLSSSLSDPKGTYDDLVAVTHGSDYVTVSWTHFHDHYAVALVGHSNSSDAVTEDTNHLTVTFHHNWFSDTQTNEPRVRFGKVHVFNNLYQRTSANAVISQMGAQVLAEGNVFQSVALPITTHYEDPDDGFIIERDNSFSGDSGMNQITQTGTWTPPYGYNADDASNVEFLVSACSGVGKI